MSILNGRALTGLQKYQRAFLFDKGYKTIKTKLRSIVTRKILSTDDYLQNISSKRRKFLLNRVEVKRFISHLYFFLHGRWYVKMEARFRKRIYASAVKMKKTPTLFIQLRNMDGQRYSRH